MIALLLDLAGLETGIDPPCPDVGQDIGITWGDITCDGLVSDADAFSVLLWLAGLPYDHANPCDEIGTLIDQDSPALR
jgi:hypothetical protein